MHECPVDGSPSFGFDRCYWHIKERALRGERLSDDELEFIGAVERPPPSSGGWRSADAFASVDIEAVLSPEDAALMQALMNVGVPGQMDFLA